MVMRISEIAIYPIKSLGAATLRDCVVRRRGLELDRRFMLVDRDGMFLTQRENSSLAGIKVDVTAADILVGSDRNAGLKIPLGELESCFNVPKSVDVWQSRVDALIATEYINNWFSSVLGTEIYLAYMSDDSERPVDKLFNSNDDIVSFADAYPLLLTNKASLAALNDRMEQAVPMNRFRPNVVVEGAAAFEEDRWKRIRIGDATFGVPKPSARCVVTTIDQNSGERHRYEPLRTLAGFRKAAAVFPGSYKGYGLYANDVLFGTNLIPESDGSCISVGDELTVLD